MLQKKYCTADEVPLKPAINDVDPFAAFESVGLDEVNRLAKMQTRVDNKYIADFGTVRSFAHSLNSDFAVLEIGGKREFTYRSCYYDDSFRCYFDHHQGRRQRFKARTRQYVDGGGLTFFEVKLKGARGLTVKHRVESDFVVHPKIDGGHLQLLEDRYREQYRKSLEVDLRPSLLVAYKRYTLVALKGGERVTIDHQLRFSPPQGKSLPIQLGDGFMIIETKSARGRGVSDKALESLGVKRESGCSKYCIGVNLIGGVDKYNAFGRTLALVRRNIVTAPRPEPVRAFAAANSHLHTARLCS
ncbi:conserved hypothetical protein [gamma proteobacterium NOR5-3]|nr:conserved hypothetical protein [gamma proteobacterium NOR5-3]